jgi:hypothetical protein
MPADGTTAAAQQATTGCPLGDHYGLPNGLNLIVSDIELSGVLEPSKPYALSHEEEGDGSFQIEIWGASAACGTADELLWWGPFAQGINCSAFTPARAHSHLLIVYRPLDKKVGFTATTRTVSLCAGGTCPGGTDGAGVTPSVSLQAPLGYYSMTTGGNFYRGYDWHLGGSGRMVLVHDRAIASQQDQADPVIGGYFKMPASDPFGDAWYCAGDGSTTTELSGDRGYTFSLKNITRLGDCAGKSGTGNASATLSNFQAQITSGFTDLAGTNVSVTTNDCHDTYCTFGFAAVPNFSWLELIPKSDVGTYYMPISTPTASTDASWFVQVDDTAPFKMTCAASGTLGYDPAATTTLDLSEMTDFVSCPGQPVDVDTFDGLAQ